MPLISPASGAHPALRAAVGRCAGENLQNRSSPKDMTGPQRGQVNGAGAALSVLAVLLVLLGSTTVQAGTPPAPIVRIESNANGEIEIDARGATIEQALMAIASKAGFEVVLDPAIQRPPVNMAVSMAAVEDVLRQILRGRNYALVYDADDASLSRVIVLPPPVVGRRPVAFRRSRR